MITQPICFENLETIVYFITIIINKSLPCIHYMNFSIQTFPPKVLVRKCKYVFSYVPWKFFLWCLIRFTVGYSQWPCILPCFNFLEYSFLGLNR